MAFANLTVYTYSNCSTCRNATKWLRDRGITFREKPIRDTPPSATELRAMLRHQNGEIRRLFNSSGMDYRALNLKERLPQLSEAEAIKLLGSNGNLIKRPFLLGRDVGLVGFNADAWKAAMLYTMSEVLAHSWRDDRCVVRGPDGALRHAQGLERLD